MASLAIVAVLKDANGSILAGYGIVAREFTDRDAFNAHISTLPLTPAPMILGTPAEDTPDGDTPS